MTLQKQVRELLAQRYWLSETGLAEPDHSFRLSDLLRTEEMDRFIRLYTALLKGSHIDVGGMYLTTWFSCVCSALQYTVSCHNEALPIRLDGIELQLQDQTDGPALAFKANRLSSSPFPGHDREDWLEAVFQSWYVGQVKPLLEAAATASGMPTAQLWAQLATRLYNTKDVMAGEAESEETKRRIEADFDFLVHRMGPRIFEGRKNLLDLNFKMVDYPAYPDRLLRVKAACCLYYKTERACGVYCFTCPKISEAEREEKRKKVLAGMK